MAIHLLRDYLTQNVSNTNRLWIPSYLASIFLRRVLGYSYVGDTNYPINPQANLLISTGDTTPTGTPSFGGNTAGMTSVGASIEVVIPFGVRGVQAADTGRIIALKSSLYPTRNSGLFLITGLDQGNTTTIAAGSNNVSLPVGTINVASTTGFPTSGTLLIGPNTTANPPTNVSVATTVTLPNATINVNNIANLPNPSGTILITTTNGIQTVTYSGVSGANLTGCSGGTGTANSGNTIQPESVLTVGSTTGFPTTGSINIATLGGTQTVAYTGITGTTFTGCTGLTNYLYTGGPVFSSNGIQQITYTNTAGGNQFTGCSGGTGTLITSEPVYNRNNYIIDYRANGDPVMAEGTTSINPLTTLPGGVNWYVYDKDINCPTNGAVNGGTGYRGNGTSTTPRIILQSPHASAWQLRICNETQQDYLSNFNVDAITFCPGFGGNAAGDFAVGGKHLHGAQFYDSATAGYNTCTGLGDNAGSGQQHRCTIVGDDGGQAAVFIGRRPADATTPESFFCLFGIPDNEPLPTPPDQTERLFALGNGAANNAGNSRMSQGSLSVGSYVNTNRIQGASFHAAPISCSPSLWTYLNPVNQQASPIYDAQAGDSPFTSATELTSVDLVVGVVHTWNDVDNTPRLPYYPRVIGNLPFTRVGRANFPEYSTTTDAITWSVSTTTGNGVSPIQVTTTTTNTLVTGQTVAINGVGGNTAANGTFVVTVINNTNFTLNGTTGNGTFTSGGTVYRGGSFQHFRFGTFVLWNGPAVVP